MNEEILKPCPFCGSETVNDTAEPVPGMHQEYYWVCPECITQGPVADTLEKATKFWNTRAG